MKCRPLESVRSLTLRPMSELEVPALAPHLVRTAAQAMARTPQRHPHKQVVMGPTVLVVPATKLAQEQGVPLQDIYLAAQLAQKNIN